MGKKLAVILGAGITGMRCAQQLLPKYDVIVLEKRPNIGGLAASFKYKDFTLDLGPHKLYSQIPGIMPAYCEILHDQVRTVEKKNSLHLFGTNFAFPVRASQLVLRFPKWALARLGISFFAAQARSALSRSEPETYEEYFAAGFGKAGYEYIFRDICRKVWGEPDEISADLARRRVPVPSIPRLALSWLRKKNEAEVSASHYYYPEIGGVGTMCDNLKQEIEKAGSSIVLNALPEKIQRKNEKYLVTYRKDPASEENLRDRNSLHGIEADVVVSTIHLKDFLGLLDQVPKEITEAVEGLHYRSLVLNYLILDTPHVLSDQWVFFPEGKFIFSRVSELKNFGVQTCPPEKTVLMVEVGCEFQDDIFNMPKDAMKERILHDLEMAGISVRGTVAEFFSVKINRMYPVYDLGYRMHLDKILDWVDTNPNLYTIGRQGLFNYSNTDHSIDMAQKAAQHIIEARPREEWKKTREYFESYRIVD